MPILSQKEGKCNLSSHNPVTNTTDPFCGERMHFRPPHPRTGAFSLGCVSYSYGLPVISVVIVATPLLP